MTTPPARYDRLENALRGLASAIDFPPEPDLRAGTMRRIEQGVARSPLSFWARAPRLVAVAAVLVASFVAVAGVLTFSPAAREAVADWLGVDGITIREGDPEEPLPPIARDLGLGTAASLDEASDAVSFEPRLPDALGEPDAVFVSSTPPGGRFSAVYRPGPGLPRTRATGVGLLLTEFRSQVKEVYAKKVVDQGVQIDLVEVVPGEPAYWVEGEHSFLFRDDDGMIREERARLAGNSLFWEHAGIVYRIESSLGLQRTLDIARSIAP